MKRNRMFKYIHYIINKTLATSALLLALLLVSCSDGEYLNAIPAESVLVVKMNTAKLSGTGNQLLLKSLLKVSQLDNTGLDLSAHVYFFEDAQGNLGLCAKMGDRDKLVKTLQGQGLGMTERDGLQFCVLPNHWVCGASEKAALLMGPVAPAAEQEMMQLMGQYLSADGEMGIKSTPLFDRLDSIDAPMALVCQSQALPEQLVAPFTLGAPKGTDASQVMISARMRVDKGCLWVDGKTFSFNEQVNDSIAAAVAAYRPIGRSYLPTISQTDAMGLFMNVDGTHFVRLMQQSPSFKKMLQGINAAIDMNNILKSVDGDMAVITPTMGDNHFQIKLAAKLAHAKWLDDVDYWKESVPAGGAIGDWGPQCYYYMSSDMAYYFGVTDDLQYFSGGTAEQALQSIKSAQTPISSKIQDEVDGAKMALVLNLAALDGEEAQTLTSLLKPMFGELKAIVYTMKD